MYPDIIGGAEIFTYDMATVLARRRHEVHVIAKNGPKFKTSLNNGIFFHAYRNLDLRGLRLLASNVILFEKLVQIKPDICLGVMFESALSCYAYKIIFHRSCLVRLAGDDFNILHSQVEGEGRLKHCKKALVFLVPYPAIFNIVKKQMPFVVINKCMYEGVLQLGVIPEHVRLIYNPIPDYFFEGTANLKNLSVVYCGRMEPEKSIDVLIKSFAVIVQSIPEAKLFLVGDGSQRRFIEELIQELELSKNATVTGLVNREKVHDFLSNAALFVLSSSHEGTPNAVLQAMALGLPIVATKVGGVPEIVDQNINGLLVEPNNVKVLAEAIHLLLVNKDLAKQFGENARSKALEFKMETAIQKYVDFFNDLINSKRYASSYS